MSTLLYNTLPDLNVSRFLILCLFLSQCIRQIKLHKTGINTDFSILLNIKQWRQNTYKIHRRIQAHVMNAEIKHILT